MSSADSDSSSSFPIKMNFIAFSYLIALARTFIIWNKIDDSGRPYLATDHKWKVFSFSLLSMMSAVDLSYMALIMLWYIYSLYTHFVERFPYEKMMNFVKCFSASTEILFLSFIFHVFNQIDWFVNVEPSLLPRINPSWSWFMILFNVLLNSVC